jgi:hypothetical protein
VSNISNSGVLNDNLNGDYVSLRFTVNATEIEAKVGAAPLKGRQTLTIYNDGNKRAFYGPTGVVATDTANKGVIIESGELVTLNVTDEVNVFLICESAQSTEVIVQEYC